jgi:hypothetical protein
MKTSCILRCTIAALAACASLVALTPASAGMVGAWDYESSAKSCSIGTKGSTGKMIMLYTASGASGMLVVPDDQSSISPDHDYPIKFSINGSADSDLNASAIKFGGATVLLIEIKAAAIAAGEADGFAMRVKLNDTVVFDKDMHGSKDAFAAFVACTKTLTT